MIALNITADKIALSALCNPIILRVDNCGIATMNSAGTIAKYFATSLAIENVVRVPRVIIPLLIPLALRGVKYRPIGASALLRRNLLVYGLGGIVAPFIGIKIIDMIVGLCL
jgi:high-affinity K+ transport system ATPase subunit B